MFVHMDRTPCGGSPAGEQEGRLQHSDSFSLRACDRYFAIRALGGSDTLHGDFPKNPILIGGDFNVTLMASDRPNDEGGRDSGSRQFRDIITELGMAEMRPSDRRFTWKGPTTQSRLDRFLCSTDLLIAYPLAEVSALPRPLSDHTPIMWTARAGPAKPTYFKLDRSWLRDGEMKNEILEWWGSRLTFGGSSEQLCTKLKDLRNHLLARRRQIRSERTQTRDVALARVRALDDIEDSRLLLLEEAKERKACRDAVEEMDLRIELDWRQRSRQRWLAAGDTKTRFFHQVANGQRRENNIRRLKIGDRVITDQAAIGQALSNHFREFYRRGPPNRWRWLATGADALSVSQQQELITPFSEEEVKKAIRHLNSEGAPGPDGIPVFFYIECWTKVGPDVMATIEEFRTGRCNMDRLNRAYIVLIPKVQGAEQIGNFRPISLSNSIYLIIAKVLANRLRAVLPSIISPFQSAFLPGRQMSESIVLAEEIVAS